MHYYSVGQGISETSGCGNHVKVSMHMPCFSSISFEHNIVCAFFQFPINLGGKGSTCHTLNVTSLF